MQWNTEAVCPDTWHVVLVFLPHTLFCLFCLFCLSVLSVLPSAA